MVASTRMTARAETNPGRRRRRLWPFLVGLIVVLAVAWVAYWYAVYRIADGFVADASALPVDESVDLACDDRHFGGFPLQITMDCTGAATRSATGSTLDLARLAVRAPLYNPGLVEADIGGPVVFDGVNHVIRSDWQGGAVDFMAGFGGISKANASFADLTFEVTDRVDEMIWSAAATAWGTEIRPAAAEGALRLVLSAEDLVITIGSEDYPTISGTAAVTLAGFGDRIDRTPERMIGDWLRAGGALEVTHMDLESGDVVAEVNGPLTLAVDGTFSGTLTIRYLGEQDLPTLVAAIFPWYADEAEEIAEAVRLMSRPIEMRGQPAHEARLIIDGGDVAIGLIPLLTIPSIGPLDHYL